MSPTPIACPTRKLLQKTVLEALEKSAIAKDEYVSARAENRDSLAIALRIAQRVESAAITVLDDHIQRHG